MEVLVSTSIDSLAEISIRPTVALGQLNCSVIHKLDGQGVTLTETSFWCYHYNVGALAPERDNGEYNIERKPRVKTSCT